VVLSEAKSIEDVGRPERLEPLELGFEPFEPLHARPFERLELLERLERAAAIQCPGQDENR
jgi:hypothetical protein